MKLTVRSRQDAEATYAYQQWANSATVFRYLELNVKWCRLPSRNKLRKHFEKALELVFLTKSQCGSKTGVYQTVHVRGTRGSPGIFEFSLPTAIFGILRYSSGQHFVTQSSYCWNSRTPASWRNQTIQNCRVKNHAWIHIYQYCVRKYKTPAVSYIRGQMRAVSCVTDNFSFTFSTPRFPRTPVS
jgi:hypothetical protein